MNKTFFLLLFVSSYFFSYGCCGSNISETESHIIRMQAEIDSLKKLTNEMNQRLIRLEERLSRRPETTSRKTEYRQKKEIPVTERIIYTGPRGGRYYINDKGKKVYVKK